MTLLSPALSRLLDAAGRHLPGPDSEASLQVLLDDALAFCQEGRKLYDLVAPGILRTPVVEGLLEDCQRDLDDQEGALDEMGEALRDGSAVRWEKAALRLRTAATSLAETYGRLQEEERKEKIYSPFPVVDHFVKTGMNVLEGRVDRAKLANRFPPVVGLVGRLERDLRRFEVLYGRPDVAGPVGDCLAGLQAGLGAGMEFFESGRPAALADSLKLLGRNSAALHEGLAEMDRAAGAARPASGHPYLEEVRRSLEAHRQGLLKEAEVADAWSLVDAALDHYRHEVEAFRQFPLFPFMEEAWRPAAAALESAARAVPEGRAAADPASLRGPFESLRQAVASLYDRLEAELDRYREAPHVEELRELVGRTLLGVGDRASLSGRVGRMREILHGLAEEAASGGLDPSLGEELQVLFAQQDQAYEAMESAAAAGDMDSLRLGWEHLEATLPRTLALVRGFRQALAEQGGASTSSEPICVRCGQASAAGTRYCASCGAILPEIQRAPTEYTDISGEGGAAEGTPTNLARLEAALARFEAGEAGLEEVEAEIGSLLELVGRVGRSLQQQVGPQASSDAKVAEFAGFFQGCLERFSEGLDLVRHHVAAGDPARVWQGLEACRQASAELLEMKQQIDGVLRGS